MGGIIYGLSGCQSGRPAGDGEAGATDQLTPSDGKDRQTAFRVRSDFDLALNADAGWAAEVNAPARIAADQPFRIRFEIEGRAVDSGPRNYQPQYRRNTGAWQPLLAENFPQPAKVMAFNFESKPEAPLTGLWTRVEGEADALTWQEADGSGFLRVEAAQSPLLALGRYATLWEPVEFAAKIRLSGEGTNQAGIVFDYSDALNHRRVDVDTDGVIQIIHVEDGRESVYARHPAMPVLDDFFELKVIREGTELVVEYEYGAEAFIFRADYDQAISLGTFGLYLPAGGLADFEVIEVEGIPRSPRTSIVAADRFDHAAATRNVIKGSTLPFGGGAGISFADRTPEWSGGGLHGEWEFPVVIRYFSDEAAMNEHGDVFEYRLVNATGQPLATDEYATVSLEVPAGHLGGTFVETPMRLGPWQSGDASLYFLMEPSETWNSLMVVKSVDGGRSWREFDGANRPATGDLEGFASRLVGDRIHMLHQTSDDVVYHVFRTADHAEYPDTWAIRDEWLASPVEPPTQVADLELRSDGSIVAVYGGPEKIHYQIRSAAGSWSDATVIDADRVPDLSGPALVRGRGDDVHLAYTGSDGSAWYRKVLPSGELTERVQFASGLGTTSDDVGSILPLVYFEQSDEVVLLYRLATGELWERRVSGEGEWSTPVRVTDRKVVQNAVDAEQTGADAIAFENSVHVLFIEAGTGHLYHTSRREGRDWTKPRRIVDDKEVQWVRGSLIRGPEGKPAYGYVYDGGADGGSGMNQFGEIPLE